MEPTRPQPNRLARKLFWAYLAISLFPLGTMLLLASVFSGQQLLGLPVYMQQRLVIAFIAIFLCTIGLVWLVTAFFGGRISALARSVQLAAQGRSTDAAVVRGNDEISETAHWFNRMADQIAHQQALLMSQDSDENTTRRQAAALVAQQALMAGSLDDLMRSSVDLFLRHFGCSFGALYLLESKELGGKVHITLAYTAGSLGEDAQPFAKRYTEKRINLDQVPTMDWMVGRALGARRPQVGPAMANSLIFEAVLPLIQPSPDGPRVIGALDLLSTTRASDARVGPFSVRTVAEMQGIANVLALTIGGFTTMAAVRNGGSPTHPNASQSTARFGGLRLDVEAIYAASSQISQAKTVDQAMVALRTAMRNAPYASAILIRPSENWETAAQRSRMGSEADTVTPANMHVVVCRALRMQPPGMNEPPLILPSPRLADLEAFILNRWEQENRHESSASQVTPLPLMLYDLDMHEEGAQIGDTPKELIDIARRMGCRSAAYLPTFRDGRLAAVLMIGASQETNAPLFRPETLEPFQNLVNIAASELERIHTTAFTQRKLAEMETLWQFTETVAMETDLNVLLRKLHQQVEQVMGKLDSFAVGLFDVATNTVRIPYMMEGGKALDIPTFPLGTGLSSEVICTGKPLLLSTAEEVKSRSAALGSLLVGEEPRSWLGAPIIYGGDVIGLIIVQDTTEEGRFKPWDAQLLSTLAAQIAIVVRNARLLDASRRQARQERLVNEIAGRIRRSADVESILKTTANELAKALGARRATIRISMDGDGDNGHGANGAPVESETGPVRPIQREVTRPDPFASMGEVIESPDFEIPLTYEPQDAPVEDPLSKPGPEKAQVQPGGGEKADPAAKTGVTSAGVQTGPLPAALEETGRSTADTSGSKAAGPIAASQSGSSPAPSRPRPNAFTLDLKSKPTGSAKIPTGPRVSPFIDPESGTTEQKSADEIRSIQTADTLPLNHSTAPAKHDEDQDDNEGKAAE